MTGASENHVLGSFNLLYSILLTEPYSSILYIDLGISNQQLQYLKAHFETIRQLQTAIRSNGFLAYRKFNWTSFPENMDFRITKNLRGRYAF